MNMKWSSEEDGILIDFVRVHDVLYNVKMKGYRQTQMKQKLWCEVGEILNKTHADCYKRWCYVRDYYIRRKGKSGICSIGEAAKNRSNRLSFLDSIHSSQGNRTTDVIKFENLEENTQDIRLTPFKTQKTEDMTSNNEEDNSTDTSNEYDDSNNDEDINNKVKGDSKNTSNLKRSNNSYAQARFNRKPPPENELDETDLFFSSMAKIVKKLPRYEQAQLRMEIGSLVGNAELRYIAIDPISVVPRSN